MATERLSPAEARRRFSNELSAFIEQRAAGLDYREITVATGLTLAEQIQYQRIVDLLTSDYGARLGQLLKLAAAPPPRPVLEAIPGGAEGRPE